MAGARRAVRTLQLYIFEREPRFMPPDTEVANLRGEAFLRAVRRAAWQPWRDARFWRDAARNLEGLPPAEVSGQLLARVCLSFQRIEIRSSELVQYCERYISERCQTLNTFELAAVLSYAIAASTGTPSPEALVKRVADEVCIEWRQRETVPWSAWRRLVCAAAEAGVPHQQLFATASPHLEENVKHMRSRDVVDVVTAFAAFGFRHTGLLAEVSRLLPSKGIANAEARTLEEAFTRLNYDAPPLHRIRKLHALAKHSS
eukprot:NODE_15511_length_1046_cov_7.245919.p1 GENE.NODE_15511_length_1046_cov_7.245919~~NODE_15511_length_1046_cov_7.245919.p1  ORF type:complete len:259 (+),score=35.28 NODE_15511_length_1046_cov_7.245919:134-910(+)